MAELYDWAGSVVRAFYDRRISGPPVLDLDHDFPRGDVFAASWQTIRDEAMNVRQRLDEVPRFHEIMPEQADISANDGRDWRMFILKAYGVEKPQNMAACPYLAGLVRDRPEVLSASFSILGPYKHIPPHRGPMRGIIRYYLMLSMPRAEDGSLAAALKVAGVEHRLEDGQFLLWDDTFEHEAWNESGEIRIVLSLDVLRPRMPLDLKILSAGLIRAVQIGMRLRGI